MSATDGAIDQTLFYDLQWIYHCLLPKIFMQMKHKSPKSMLSRIVHREWIRVMCIPTLLGGGRRGRTHDSNMDIESYISFGTHTTLLQIFWWLIEHVSQQVLDKIVDSWELGNFFESWVLLTILDQCSHNL